MLFKKEIKKTYDRHEVIKFIEKGHVKYSVKYIQQYEISFFMFGNCIIKYKSSREQTSPLKFNDQTTAEAYAKMSYKCDKRIAISESRKLFIMQARQFDKYGYFEIWLPGERYAHINYSVKFVFYNKAKFGSSISSGQLHVDFFQKLDDVIRKIKSQVDTLDKTPSVVSYFDVGTEEIVPYDKLKASSEEIEQLNKLLAQYREEQQKYNDFLKKLLSK